MTTITTYRLRAVSAAALHALLVTASAGKERPYAWSDADGDYFDDARVRLPYEETAPGAPVTNGDITYTPDEPTGLWLCEISLVDDVDEVLAAVALS